MSGDGQPQLDAMSSEFVAEIKDDLASLEPDLLVMEEKGANVNDDLINHAFRAIHSIKGGAGFIDFKALSSLSHAMENVLMRVREKNLVITSNIVDALLGGFDKMKLMVDLIGTDQSLDHQKETSALERVLQENDEEDDEKVPQSLESEPEKAIELLTPLGDSPFFEGKTFFVDKTRLENALGSQKFIYSVYIRPEEDLRTRKKDAASMLEDIKSIGDILYSGLDESPFYCIISTILDLPLLSQVLEIDILQMALMDKQFTDCEKILKSMSAKAVPVADGQTPNNALQNLVEPVQKPVDMQIHPSPETAQNSQTIRVNVDLISTLMNRAGELVLSRNQLRPFMEAEAAENTHASHMMQNLDMVTTDIQEAIMQMRMQPVIDLLGKYKRVVRDIARRMDKKVELELEGAGVEVDRNVLEKLANPLTHLIRNCIDHGIETPEERVLLGKDETGRINIKTAHQGGHVHIVISDDGTGIDPQLILSKAFEKGLVSEDQVNRLTDKQKVDLIFLPGFSTSQEITDISGRGVGMDVVKTNIERLRGQIEIDSIKGKGTTIQLIIPLTLAIVPSLIVSSGESKFAIPQANIKEVIFLEPGRIHEQVGNIAGSEVLRLREHLIPILRLRNVLDLKTYVKSQSKDQKLEEKRRAIADRRQDYITIETPEQRQQKPEQRQQNNDRRKIQWDQTYVILLKLGANYFGLCVDELYDIEEVVVEPLNECIKHLKCFAGATILGDGDVIMILDVPGIASVSSLKFDSIKKEELKQNRLREKAEENKGETRDLIVFRNADQEYFAMELKQVARLEPVIPSDIHHTDTLKYLEYNRQAVLLYSMEEFLPASPCDLSGEQVFAIFPKDLSTKVGVIAAKVVDTIQTNEKISKDAACPDTVLGKIFVDDMMIQVLDHEKMISLIEQKTIAERNS